VIVGSVTHPPQTLHSYLTNIDFIAQKKVQSSYYCYYSYVTGPRTLGRGVNERGCGYIVSVSTARWHAQPAPKEAGASQDLYIFAHWQDSRVARLSLLSGRSYPFVHMHSDLKLIVKVLVAVVYSHEPGVDVHYARAATRNYCFTYKA